MAKNLILHPANRIQVCRDYAELWQTYFSIISEEGIQEKDVTEEEEDEFQNILSLLAVNHYKFEQLVGPDMGDASAVLKVIADTPSIHVVKGIPEATYAKLLIDWHKTFIDMNKALGRMLGRLTPKDRLVLQQMEAAHEQEAESA